MQGYGTCSRRFAFRKTASSLVLWTVDWLDEWTHSPERRSFIDGSGRTCKV